MYNKYRNVKTLIDGIKFDSKKEASRYCELLLLQKRGDICELELQPTFEICRSVRWNGKTLRRRIYRADFMYKNTTSRNVIVEDVKGHKTREYLLKRSLFLDLYGQYTFIET